MRSQSSTRDCFFKETDGDAFAITIEAGEHSFGMGVQLNGNADSDTTATIRIPSFGTNYVHRGYQSDTRVKLYLDTTDKDSAATKDNTASYGSYAHLTSSLELGVYKFGANAVSGQRGDTDGFDIVTPTHSSSHYQSFETPYLHELVGGDRNMEQTNLIVTPDGKSWDQVTRDTSYLSNVVLCVRDSEQTWNTNNDWAIQRGFNWQLNCGIKNSWVNAYDRFICLIDGEYTVAVHSIMKTTGSIELKINGTTAQYGHAPNTATNSIHSNCYFNFNYHFKRGDYMQMTGQRHGGVYSHFTILKTKR